MVSIALGCVSLAGGQPAKEAPKNDTGVEKINPDDVNACLACHSEDIEGKHKVDTVALKASPHKDLSCQDCHSSMTGSPHTPEMIKEKVACANCHSDQQEAYANSVHAKKDLVKGDHPTCISCHAGKDPHTITKAASRTRLQNITLCTDCHSQTDRMKRYNVDVDAVHSYNESFHGKALLKFGMGQAAACVDCHKAHEVRAPKDPLASTNRANAAKMCSAQGCHPGANVNYAMSGANHLRLKIKENSVLAGIDFFFKGLVLVVILFMLGGVALDLRLKVLGPEPPPSGRLVGVLVAISFAGVLATLGFAVFGISQFATKAALFAVGFLVLAYLLYFLVARRYRKPESGKTYARLTLEQRVQHGLLAIVFTALILTGLPQRFSNIDWLVKIYRFTGGPDGARLIHRVAAVGLIAVFLWHTLGLLRMGFKNGFKLSGWSMFPRMKDIQDFVHDSKMYLGLTNEPPRRERFHYKQKMDYLAEYWGVPLMVITGFILWFPIYWGNRLPEIAISAALVAHGWEATLAFLAIITWHIYNEQFSPDSFPMNWVWITGRISEERMKHEHALEYERLQKEESGQE